MRTKVRIQSTFTVLKDGGTTREAADGDRVRRERDGDETGDETGGPRDETGDKTAATAGDERDDGDRWDNAYGRRGVRI